MNSQNRDDYLGSQIRTARVVARLSQKQLGDELGIPVYRISDIENGHEHVYLADLVKRLCEALGVEYGDGR